MFKKAPKAVADKKGGLGIMTRFLSVLLCAVALICRAMQTYKRAGHPIYPAVITGFSESSRLIGMNAKNYTVRYQKDGEEILATAIESVPLLNGPLDKYVGKTVEVFVDPKTPQIVSIRGDHSMDISCGLLLLVGIFGILIS